VAICEASFLKFITHEAGNFESLVAGTTRFQGQISGTRMMYELVGPSLACDRPRPGCRRLRQWRYVRTKQRFLGAGPDIVGDLDL
jgi:hypothetical protein